MIIEYTFDENTVSDFHKDSYGFRPSHGWWTIWHTSTDSEKQAIWDDLGREMEQRNIRENDREVLAIEKFEKLVAETISYGAKTRQKAIEWLMQGTSYVGDDVEFFEYTQGIPYGYVNRTSAQ